MFDKGHSGLHYECAVGGLISANNHLQTTFHIHYRWIVIIVRRTTLSVLRGSLRRSYMPSLQSPHPYNGGSCEALNSSYDLFFYFFGQDSACVERYSSQV